MWGVSMNFEDLRDRVQSIAKELPGKLSVMVVSDLWKLHMNASDKISAASLIKVPIMMAAYKKAREGRLDLELPVTVPLEKRVGGMGVVTHLAADTSLKLSDLITLMIIVSDNTATNLCIDHVGIEYINSFMDEVGCKNSILGRRLMDYEARKAGKDNFVSAEDMVTLLRCLWSDTSIEGEKMRSLLYAQQFNTKLPYLIPSETDTRVAHKTGEIPGVEHDAGVVEVGGNRAFVAVLTHELESKVAGYKAIQDIGLAVWQFLKSLD